MYRRNLDDLEKVENSPILSLLLERYESVWLSAAVLSKRKKWKEHAIEISEFLFRR